jgi:hypothetical protein
MNVQPIAVEKLAAQAALKEYKAHRSVYDKRDWEIEKIYRQIARGRTVISVNDAIIRGGIDQLGRPRLAIMRADQTAVRCSAWRSDRVQFCCEGAGRSSDLSFEIPWANRSVINNRDLRALLPRIPPQHRPAAGTLAKYHILWEADWTAIPRDPYLLKRIGKDAWVVLAAWDLTDVEMSVLWAHSVRQ